MPRICGDMRSQIPSDDLYAAVVRGKRAGRLQDRLISITDYMCLISGGSFGNEAVSVGSREPGRTKAASGCSSDPLEMN